MRAQKAAEGPLGPDDVLAITVLRHPELSADRITVPSSGKIDLPLAGQIKVAGLTPQQVAHSIAKVLSKDIIAPEVTVSLREQRLRQVFLLGTGVARPGVYPVKPNWRVTEALAAAGGVPGRDDETSLVLSRTGSKPLTIDIVEIGNNPASKQNVRLQAGDVLTIAAQEPRRITVSGDVVKPDAYELRRAPRLLNAIVAAGGLKAGQRSQNTRAFLLRKAQRTELDLAAAEASTTGASNTPLQPGDVIIVEAIPPLQIAVDGFVRKPGNFNLDSDSGVIKAIAAAEGLTVPADQVVATIRRGREIIPVDLTRAAYETGADIPLKTGDVVLLSEPKVIRIQVTGQVNRPGPLRLPLDKATVLEAVSRVGGLAGKTETTLISVLRTDGAGRQVPLQIDAVSLLDLRDVSQNAKLQDGDLISVTPIQATSVFVSGQVQRPGAYEVKPGDGIPELIARAGGSTDLAALTRVTLQRGTESRTVDVYSALKEGGAKPDIVLREGDFVVVPPTKAIVKVIQAVQKPGDYAIPEHGTLTVADAISLAGGPRDRAAVKEITVLRETPEGTRSRVIRYDAIASGDLKQNIALQPGDIVYVPPAKTKGGIFQTFGSILGLAGTARYLGGF